MPCGCQAACGCVVKAGAGMSVQRLSDTFIITNTQAAPIVQVATVDGAVNADTNIAIFTGTTPSTTLPPALAGASLELWNHSSDTTDLHATPQGGDVFAPEAIALWGSPLAVNYPGAARLVCHIDGEWQAHVY